MQEDISALRERINELDKRLVQLLNERVVTALQIGKLKAQKGIPVYDPARERVVLEHINRANQGPLDKGHLEEIFADIITACRELQSR